MIEKTNYGGWPNCYRVTNGEVELIATTDVGPRIIRYGFVGGQNLFVEFDGQIGNSKEMEWQPRGGHRLWAAPEIKPDTYALDNSTVEANVQGDVLSLRQAVEAETGLRKEIRIKLSISGEAEITHLITNTRSAPRELAPWALTMLATGGMAIVEFPPRGTHDKVLLPTNPLTMWAYTDFSDERWKFTKRYLILKQDVNMGPQKTGLFNEKMIAGYLLGTDLFVKQATAAGKAQYPDYGCSYETFTNQEFLEIETLGPLTQVKQDETASHVERWSLYKDVKLAEISDEELDRIFAPARD